MGFGQCVTVLPETWCEFTPCEVMQPGARKVGRYHSQLIAVLGGETGTTLCTKASFCSRRDLDRQSNH